MAKVSSLEVTDRGLQREQREKDVERERCEMWREKDVEVGSEVAHLEVTHLMMV